MTPRRRLWFDLALACGWPHPGPLWARMTAAEVLEAERVWSAEPFGQQRMDWLAASIVQAVQSPWSKRPVKLDRCRVQFRTERKAPAELRKTFLAFAQAHNAALRK